jgi:hypothetical protein
VRGSLGLVIGLVVGAGGMYLALRPPWGGGATTQAPIDAGPVASIPGDAGTGAKPKKKRKRPPGTVTPPGQTGSDEEYEETDPLPVLTASDRQFEWRGDDVTPPPTKIDMGGGAESRPLDSGEINTTLGSQAGPVKDCVIASVTNTDLRGEFHVKLLVDGTGKVSKSRVQAPRYTFQKGLLTCVQRAAGRMKFPAVGGSTSVDVPVTVN